MSEGSNAKERAVELLLAAMERMDEQEREHGQTSEGLEAMTDAMSAILTLS